MGSDAHDSDLNPLTREFLEWVSSRPRTYLETMEAWRSHCPRQPVWEDALMDGLVRVDHGSTEDQSQVTLTASGKAWLDGSGRF